MHMMQHPKIQRCILVGAVLCSALSGGRLSPVCAQNEDIPLPAPTPTPRPKMPSGPSAKMAAKLKRNPAPAPAWVQHYLPDDRYKVAGGIWKYVSTELDTYYHLPNSSLMLRQPNTIVIGFSSREQAEEAGYRPGPSVQTQIQQTQERAIAARGPKAFTRTTTVTLGDGKSQVTVPAGWTHIGNSGFRMANFSMDMFLAPGASMNYSRPKPGQMPTPPRMVMVMTMTNPQGRNIEAGLDANMWSRRDAQTSGMNEAFAGLSSQNPQFGQFSKAMNDIEARPSSWGGAKAVRLSSKSKSPQSLLLGNMIIAARGPKMYMFMDTSRNAKGVGQIRNSFVAR